VLSMMEEVAGGFWRYKKPNPEQLV
jgi:hypothetical protein